MTAVEDRCTERSTSPDEQPDVPLEQPDEGFSALVVDDQPQVRAAITARLATLGAVHLDEAASVEQARACAATSGPCDLAILALSLPGGGVVDLLAELRARGWPRVAVLVTANDADAVVQAIEAGAHPYLLRPALPGAGAGPGHRPGAPVVAGASAAADGGVTTLSGREIEVLQLVADGRSNKEIGATLRLSALTVKSHLSRVGRKLNTGDRARMVALAMRFGAIH